MDKNGKLEFIHPIKKIDLKGKKISAESFFSQLIYYFNKEKKLKENKVPVITGATLSCSKIIEGINETIELVNNELLHKK